MSGRNKTHVYHNVTIRCIQTLALWTLLRWSYLWNSWRLTL